MRIAVIYNLPENTMQDLAVNESMQTAYDIKNALSGRSHSVDIIKVTPDAIARLKEYDFVFNLAESTAGCVLSENQIAQMMENKGIRFTGSPCWP